MIVELAPAVEQVVLARAAACGQTPDELVNNLLAQLAGPAPALANPPAAQVEDTRDPRSRMHSMREAVSENFGPPAGARFRDWIHEGSRY